MTASSTVRYTVGRLYTFRIYTLGIPGRHTREGYTHPGRHTREGYTHPGRHTREGYTHPGRHNPPVNPPWEA